MTAPHTSTITPPSLENFSLNDHHHISGASSSRFDDEVATSGHPPIQASSETSSDDTTLELDSHVSLPLDQCFHLKRSPSSQSHQKNLVRREIYHTNRRNDMATNEDPMNTQEDSNDSLYSEEEEEDSFYDCDESSYESSTDDSDDSSTDDSDESSTDPSFFSSDLDQTGSDREEVVLVVAGCKRCYMYLMVPKGLQGCPRCNSPLIHFDGSSNGFH